MALRRPSLFILLLIAAGLLLSFVLVPGVAAQADEFDSDDSSDGPAGEFEAAGGGGTEVVATGEDAAEEGEEEALLSPAPGVETVVLFPAFVGKTPTIRAGQQAEMLFSINNEASAPLKILAVISRLFLTYDYRMHAQNFTGELPSNVTVINATVPRGAQSSFAFHFTPLKYLQPMTFGLASTVYYEMEGSAFASVLFNSTVEIIEPAGLVSGETVFLVLLGAGVLTLLGMWASTQLETLRAKSKRSKKTETGTGDSSDATKNEWLQGTYYSTGQGKQVQQRKRR